MKIIICDDEKYICQDLEKRLREYYQSLDVLILSVCSGEELLRIMEQEPEGVPLSGKTAAAGKTDRSTSGGGTKFLGVERS